MRWRASIVSKRMKTGPVRWPVRRPSRRRACTRPGRSRPTHRTPVSRPRIAPPASRAFASGWTPPSAPRPPIGAQDPGEVAALVEEVGRVGELARNEATRRAGARRAARARCRSASARCARPGPARCSARHGRRPSWGTPCFWRPPAPRQVPAKYTPGTVVLSQKGVWTGSRLARPATPNSEVASGGVNPVAAMTSSTSRAIRPAVGRLDDRRRPSGRPLDPVDRGVQDADAATQDVILVRLDVAGPNADERLRRDRQRAVVATRARSGSPTAGGRSRARSRTSVADDEDPLSGIGLGARMSA